MNVYQEFSSIAKALDDNTIPYMLVGGVAMAFHDQPRFTKDVDLMTTPEHAESLCEALLKLDYFESARPWTFSNTRITLRRFMKTEGEDFLFIDVMIGSDDRTREIMNHAVTDSLYGIPVKVASKADLIYLKSLRNSDQDKVDIKRLQDDEIRKDI